MVNYVTLQQGNQYEGSTPLLYGLCYQRRQQSKTLVKVVGWNPTPSNNLSNLSKIRFRDWILNEIHKWQESVPVCAEAKGVTHGGAAGSKNVGTSNHNACENHARRKTKVSFAMTISEGLVGPKGMEKSAPDGHMVNIP